jgi:hypothetical protein
MTGCGQTWRFLAVRFLISLPFLAASLVFFLDLSPVRAFLAAGFLLPPAFILTEPLSELFAHPIGSLYHSGKRRSEPALMFSQPEACIMRGKYAQAMEHYRSMTLLDPKEARIYVGMVDLALRHLGDRELAAENFHQGMAAVETMDGKRLLADEYRRLLVLFDSRELH